MGVLDTFDLSHLLEMDAPVWLSHLAQLRRAQMGESSVSEAEVPEQASAQSLSDWYRKARSGQNQLLTLGV